jgi:filamentous hemagglutinin family protein
MGVCFAKRYQRKAKKSSGLAVSIAVSTVLLSLQATAVAQSIVPDTTLPTNSIVTPGNCTTCTITGGTTAGTNLYHSFQQFSVPTDGSAYFNNAVGIQNIITRVTGGSVSSIDGLLRTNNANLFLINPAGIIFGANASLNIGGSFIASTANSLRLADGTDFSAVSPQSTPLLSISVPLGLQYGSNPGKIQVQGSGHRVTVNTSNFSLNRTNRPAGLQVASGQTLALVGGDVSLSGGNVTSASGRIALGAVKQAGFVALTPTNPGWSLDYSGITNFGDVRLTNAASADVSSTAGGEIRVQGRQVTLTGGSTLLATTIGSGQGRGITIKATESLDVLGFSGTAASPIFPSSILTDASVGTTAASRGGNISIETGQLRVTDGAQVSASALAAGSAGNLNVKAQTIDLVGNVSPFGSSGLFTNVVNTNATGNGGNIAIETDTLRISNGASIASSTRGIGNAGNTTVRARTIEVLGESRPSASGATTPSNIASSAVRGRGGNVILEAERVRLTDGAQVIVSTTGTGNSGTLTVRAAEIDLIGSSVNRQTALSATVNSNTATGSAGNLDITAGRLRVLEGAQISVATRGVGNAGNLNINAQEIELAGGSRFGITRSGLFATAIAGLSGSTVIGGTGNGGSINVTTDRLEVRDGALISASNFPSVPSATVTAGRGAVGNITVRANSILLDQGGKLTTNSAGANSSITREQANITVRSESLVLRRGSAITANAQGTARGGNIAINSDFIVAVSTENSDITANAANNFGGRVTISTVGILGIEPRAQLTPLSDITASSALGSEFNGVVEINTPNVDPSQGLVEVPAIVDSNTRISANCGPGGANQFIMTGRGGLPELPEQTRKGEALWQDFRLAEDSSAPSTPSASLAPIVPVRSNPDVIVEAQGWTRDANGKVVLVAHAPQSSGTQSHAQLAQCDTGVK